MSNIDKIIESVSSMTENEMFILRTKMAAKFKIDIDSMNSGSIQKEEESVEETKLKTLFIKDYPEDKRKDVASILSKILKVNLLNATRIVDKPKLPAIVKEELKKEEIEELKKLFGNITGILFEEK